MVKPYKNKHSNFLKFSLSTSTDNITSVSRQNHNFYHRRRRKYHRRQPSRASSFSSMTETSMALEVITVTFNMDTVSFLGISIVGQSCARGDNGVYVYVFELANMDGSLIRFIISLFQNFQGTSYARRSGCT